MTHNLPTARLDQIVAWLQESQTLTIEDLAIRLGISLMTVHRDLDKLERAGLVKKVHGGVTLSMSQPLSGCALCRMDVSPRLSFIIQIEAQEPIEACCPHCGFLLLNRYENVASVLARDFLYGRMINAGQAIFLIESQFTPCCIPSVLCFSCQEDVARFQHGFRGQIMSFQGAKSYLMNQHRQL